MAEQESVKKIPACPNCGKSYGVNVRKDGTIRCKLCGYEGERNGANK